jgi:hypothetical protein
MSTVNKTPIALVGGGLGAAGTSVAAGAATYNAKGSRDMRQAFGGLLSIKMTNGGSGPGVQCTCNVYISHAGGATPSISGTSKMQGNDWKTLASFGGGTAANAITEQVINIPMSAMHIAVEFGDHTTNAVTCEAQLSEASSIT